VRGGKRKSKKLQYFEITPMIRPGTEKKKKKKKKKGRGVAPTGRGGEDQH